MGKKAVSYLLGFLLVIFTILLLVATILSRQASYISPATSEWGGAWAAMAFLMPVFLCLNLVALIGWLVRGRWVVALIPLAAWIINLEYLSTMIQLPDFGSQKTTHDLRIMTVNSKGLRGNGPVSISARALCQVSSREQVDVLCLQEFADDGTFSADSIAQLFAQQLPYFAREKRQAILSRYPIQSYQYVQFPNTDNNYLQADLQIGAQCVRLFSVHLQTSGISSLRHRFRKDYNREAPIGWIIEGLQNNSRIRAQQADDISREVEAAPGPVILVGDFNDMPSAYTYRRMKGDLTDGFQAVGSGYGGTFREMGGLLRLDYIFYNDFFTGVDYRILQEPISDHKAVVADLRFNQ